jgi:hypothetical protein
MPGGQVGCLWHGVPTGFFYGILSLSPFGFKICDGCDILAYHKFSQYSGTLNKSQVAANVGYWQLTAGFEGHQNPALSLTHHRLAARNYILTY